MGGLKHYMLPVVLTPVAMKNSVGRIESVEKGGAGEGGHDCEAREVDLRGEYEISHLIKCRYFVAIISKHKGAVDQDTERMKIFDELGIFRWIVKAFIEAT